MFSKILENLYVKVFINIVVKTSSTEIYVEIYSKKGILNHFHHQFETTKESEELISFVQESMKESPYYYISILDYSNSQGAIPTCLESKLNYYHDISSSEYKCFDNKWVYYTSLNDIYEIKKRYKTIGIDFLFSPFVVLHNFFKDKIVNNMALYILIEDNYIFMSVYKESFLLYAQQLDIHKEVEHIEETFETASHSSSDNEDDIELDSIDLDDSIESLDDFGDIEDLDALDEIEQFSENKDIEEEFQDLDVENEIDTSSSDMTNQDYNIYALIEKSLNIFYSDRKYESDFIENIYIADSAGVSGELKRYLEEEMFLNVYVRHIDLVQELCELAKEELGL